MIAASVILLIGDVLVASVMIACVRGRIGVNSIAGIRTRNLMASEEAWRVGHQAALPATLIGTVLSVVLAIVSFFQEMPQPRTRSS